MNKIANYLLKYATQTQQPSVRGTLLKDIQQARSSPVLKDTPAEQAARDAEWKRLKSQRQLDDFGINKADYDADVNATMADRTPREQKMYGMSEKSPYSRKSVTLDTTKTHYSPTSSNKYLADNTYVDKNGVRRYAVSAGWKPYRQTPEMQTQEAERALRDRQRMIEKYRLHGYTGDIKNISEVGYPNFYIDAYSRANIRGSRYMQWVNSRNSLYRRFMPYSNYRYPLF